MDLVMGDPTAAFALLGAGGGAMSRHTDSRRYPDAMMRFSDHLPDAFDPGGDGDDEHLAELDRDFPLGDGTADVEATVRCPWCAAPVSIALDPGSGVTQDYVEDCEVCCRPWRVSVRYGADGAADVTVDALGA